VIAEGIPSSTQCNSRYDRIRQKERAAVGSGSPVSACQPRLRDRRGLAGIHLESFKLRGCSSPPKKILRRGSQNVTSKKICAARVRMSHLLREWQRVPSASVLRRTHFDSFHCGLGIFAAFINCIGSQCYRFYVGDR
jgi:hypothetical protein